MIKYLENIPVYIGKWVSWLTTLLVILIFCDVVFRYVFKFSKTWIIDLEWHLFAAVFLLGAAYTLSEDKHVRVDVFYNSFSEKKKGWVNIIGTVFLLIPWTILIISKSYHYAMNSWLIGEGSPDPGGLGARYVIKFVMLLAFILLLIQAIITLVKEVKKLKGTWK
jgi:TRAP-type mannitol/chloroaromatic compound transport system permease small subunit